MFAFSIIFQHQDGTVIDESLRIDEGVLSLVSI